MWKGTRWESIETSIQGNEPILSIFCHSRSETDIFTKGSWLTIEFRKNISFKTITYWHKFGLERTRWQSIDTSIQGNEPILSIFCLSRSETDIFTKGSWLTIEFRKKISFKTITNWHKFGLERLKKINFAVFSAIIGCICLNRENLCFLTHPVSGIFTWCDWGEKETRPNHISFLWTLSSCTKIFTSLKTKTRWLLLLSEKTYAPESMWT
jgi:hypothetical protein